MHKIEANSPIPQVDYLLAQQVHEVTNGFLFRNAEELAEVYYELIRRGVSRLPIIGMRDGRIFFLANCAKSDHQTLLNRLNQVDETPYPLENVLFTTSLEEISRDVPQRPYLILHLPLQRKVYIRIGKGSDRLPIVLGATDLRPLFESETIEVVL